MAIGLRPEREMLQAAIDESQQNVSGTVRLKLYKGNVIVVGRKSDRSLYNPEVASFDESGEYQQADAEGFIRLNSPAFADSWTGPEVGRKASRWARIDGVGLAAPPRPVCLNEIKKHKSLGRTIRCCGRLTHGSLHVFAGL